MNNELTLWDQVSIPVQTVFNWDETFAETKELVKRDAELTTTIDEARVERFHGRVKIGFNLMALQADHSRKRTGDFTTVELPKLGITDRMFPQRCINSAKLVARLGGIPNVTSLLHLDLFDVPMPLDTWNKLSSPSNQTVVEQLESGEIKPKKEDITKALEDLEEERKRSKKLRQDLEAKDKEFALFKDEVESNAQSHTALVQSLEQQLDEKPEVIEQRKKELEEKIQAYVQKHKMLEQENQQKLDEDLDKQKQQLKQKLKDEEDNLKQLYAEKDQQRQFKAEKTIHSLLSHGIKSMAETQLTIEHTVSSGMLQAVLQLGGSQVRSLLAQINALQETLDQARERLTQGDYIVLTERVDING